MRALLRLFLPDPAPPLNTKGGRLRAIVARAAHSPVHGMEVVGGRWWAHTAHGYHPVQFYLEEAHKRKQGAFDEVA